MQGQATLNQHQCVTPKAGQSVGDITLDETISAIHDKESSVLQAQLQEEKIKRQKLSKLYSS